MGGGEEGMHGTGGMLGALLLSILILHRARTLAKGLQRPPDGLKFDISCFHNLSKARYIQCGKI